MSFCIIELIIGSFSQFSLYHIVASLQIANSVLFLGF
jgi:hypothetical protein